MNEFYPNEQVKQREELIALYVVALDSNDFETAFSVLEAAQVDPELDRLINEINRDYEREIESAPFLADAAMVSGLLREHLPSAFESENAPQPKTITMGDVARQIEAKGKVSAQGDAAANKQLLEAKTPLPKHLSLPEIRRVLGELKIKASEKFFRLFHETAILIEMRQGHQLGLQAAREKRIRRQTNKTTKPTEAEKEAKFLHKLNERSDETND